MAHLDGDKQSWDDDDDRFYSSSRDSDDSPVLLHRYDRYRRYEPYVSRGEERERRSTITVVAKFFLFSTAMIMFCVLLYIPVYNKANDQVPKGLVAGWSIHTNRDTKIYVRPHNVTTIHEPTDVCPKSHSKLKNKLFLLIFVCSSTVNFEERLAIRETWGNYRRYLDLSKVFHFVRDKYKNYNYTYDLYPEPHYEVSGNVSGKREKSENRVSRDISGFGQLLPELAKALKNNMVTVKTNEVPVEKRFDDDDEAILPEFDMNKELGDQNNDNDYEYNDESNIMRIPPKGLEDSPSLDDILKMLKDNQVFPEKNDEEDITDPDFKLVFLLGLPSSGNDTDVQSRIDDEVEKYGDVIQEDFIDSYNNLTLKSIMMLKWITNKCNESVRYILKTDDDMYINVPNLIMNLRNRSREFDSRLGNKGKEYMLIGDLICGARPVLDSNNKWYSPRYMYGGRVYPRYLSGTAYALSSPAAHALYKAALNTHYFHLEDIYITGLCARRAAPAVEARGAAGFSYRGARGACGAHAQVSAHRVPPARMRTLHAQLADHHYADKCERMRLTQVRHDRLKPKTTPQKTKLVHPLTK